MFHDTSEIYSSRLSVLSGCGKEVDFRKCNGSHSGFKQGNDMIKPIFVKGLFVMTSK